MPNQIDSARTNREAGLIKRIRQIPRTRCGKDAPSDKVLRSRIKRLEARESVLSEEVCQLRGAIEIYREVVKILRSRNPLPQKGAQ